MPTPLPARVAQAAPRSDVPVFLAIAMTVVLFATLTLRTPVGTDAQALAAQGLAGAIYGALPTDT